MESSTPENVATEANPDGLSLVTVLIWLAALAIFSLVLSRLGQAWGWPGTLPAVLVALLAAGLGGPVLVILLVWGVFVLVLVFDSSVRRQIWAEIRGKPRADGCQPAPESVQSQSDSASDPGAHVPVD